MPPAPHLFAILAVVALLPLRAVAVPGMVSYERDVQPILAQHCYSCHGPDKHKAGLRLDDRAAALTGSDAGKVILPGNSAESLLIRNVSGHDPDAIMPPEGEGERLSAEQIALLRAWIDGGAFWPDNLAKPAAQPVTHWSFRAPERPALPAVRDAAWVRTPVDAFVLARLEREGIAPSPEADRGTLVRRLTLDLTGLLPTPEDVRAFVHDRRPDAYERVVDRLLASAHFGERWGRHWLDLARYADSDGYEKDSPRPYAYLFRDWVIDAINRDLPFDQFTIEQMAGDLLPDATDRQRIATGFHRQTLTNREGGVDREEFRTKATVDRVSTTGSVWLGLTIGCAECHTHKFDPITQREFYQLYAFFNHASEKDLPAPQPSELAEYARQLDPWEAKRAVLEPALAARAEQLAGEPLRAWEAALTVPKARWSVLRPGRVVLTAGESETVLPVPRDGVISPRQRDTVRGRYTIEATTNLKGITGFRVEAMEETGRPVGRGPGGEFALGEFAVRVRVEDGGWRRLEVKAARVTAAAPGTGAEQAIDGDPATGWSVGPKRETAQVIVFELAESLPGGEGTQLEFELDQTATGLINRIRLAVTRSPLPLDATTLPDDVVAILQTPADRRNAKQVADLTRHFVEQVDPDGRRLHAELQAHFAKKPKAPETKAAVMEADVRETHVHIRGDFLRPGDRVEPATPGILHPLQARSGKPDRLDLARWLVDPANPLTARVAVNHIWMNLFGRALVATVEDFGTRGEPPSHPDLLDWLALAFRGSPSAAEAPPGLGWSRKALIREIVTSATYRQASRLRPELAQRDPNNVLLARQNRFRLEAETVRDIHLAASGLLHPVIGGPSIRPQLPADIAALGYANSVKWQASAGADQYRRGLYIFFQRTVPFPMLMTFDAPDSNTSCSRRERSNTPLQALTLLNDPVFFECAQQLGRRIAVEAAGTDERIRRVFQICLARDPEPAEVDRIRRHLAEQERLLQNSPGSAAKIAGVTDAAGLDEQAAWITVCRVVMNLDEFLTRE